MHQIGVGVLGPVFRAYDPDGGRLVAIKVFHLDILPEEVEVLSVALSGVVQGGMEHPSLVTPVGTGISDGVPYLALEYVAAESLDVVLRNRSSTTVETVLPLVVQLAEVLDAAHEKGQSHGALHPRDVFVTQELVRVTGFGVVSALAQIGLRGPIRRPYTAPEQIAGADWGPPADRFSLAAVTYELLTGKRAAGAGEQVANSFVGLSGVPSTVKVAELFSSALSEEADARPSSAGLFADELADAMGWNGSGTASQELGEHYSGAGDREQDILDDLPMTVVDGPSEPLFTGAEMVGIERGVLSMARNQGTDASAEPTFDWTERTLDRGDSDELREQKGYQPRPPGALLEAELVERAEQSALSGSNQPNVALDGVAWSKGGEGSRGASSVRTTKTRQPMIQEGSTGRQQGVGFKSGGRSSHVKDQIGITGSLFAQLDTNSSADTVDVDLSVVQARYRSIDPFEPANDTPNRSTADVHEVVSQSNLLVESGEIVDSSDEVGDASWDQVSHAGLDARHDDTSGLDDRTAEFQESDGEDDREHPGPDRDGPRMAFPASELFGRVRELTLIPLVLVSVAVLIVAFVVGFGWFAIGNGGLSGGSVPVETIGAGELVVSSDTRKPVEPTVQPGEESGANAASGSLVQGDSLVASMKATTTLGEPVVAELEERSVPTVTTDVPVVPAPVTSNLSDLMSSQVGGRLLVRSIPPGVLVIANGQELGPTPLALADLSYGDYDVRLSLEGYESQEHRLEVSSDNPIGVINVRLTRATTVQNASLRVGSILVETRPRGAEVWIDQELMGESPILISNVSAGIHEVEFRHDGYRNWVTTVRVWPSTQARVTASLDYAPR